VTIPLERGDLSSVGRNCAIADHHVGHFIAAWRHRRGGEEMFGKTIVATIMRKGDEGSAEQLYIIVRSHAIAIDKVITISQADFDVLHPGMLVNVRHVGWGPFSAWWLRH
jgi:hypothetical protein